MLSERSLSSSLSCFRWTIDSQSGSEDPNNERCAQIRPLRAPQRTPDPRQSIECLSISPPQVHGPKTLHRCRRCFWATLQSRFPSARLEILTNLKTSVEAALLLTPAVARLSFDTELRRPLCRYPSVPPNKCVLLGVLNTHLRASIPSLRTFEPAAELRKARYRPNCSRLDSEKLFSEYPAHFPGPEGPFGVSCPFPSVIDSLRRPGFDLELRRVDVPPSIVIPTNH